MYAIVEVNKKQYRVTQGERLKLDLLDTKEGESLTFDKVLFYSDGTRVQVGAPYVAGVRVAARVNAQIRDKKFIVFKYIPKKDHRRTRGHRQRFTEVTIESISS